MANRDGRRSEEERPKGLKGLLGGLFSKKQPEPEDEDDFRPAASLYNRSAPAPRVQGAQAPSRAAITAATAALRNADAPERQPYLPRRPAPREDPENQVSVRGNKLYELHRRMNGKDPSANAGGKFSLSLFTPKGEPPDAEQRAWLRAIEREVRGMPQYATPKPAPADSDEEVFEFPVDAYAFVRVAGSGMAVYLFLIPPLNGGQPLPSEWVLRLLEEQQVTVGIDHEAIARACASGNYLQLVPIAAGVPPLPGSNGEIVDHFSREVQIRLKVLEDNTINFKDLGWLQTVRKDGVICDIVLPTPGTPGMTVRGKPVPAADGRYAPPPKGPGTYVSEDGTALLATQDGILSFIGGSFRVDPILIVKGDVDNAIGNLDVMGDILIYGDIRDFFTVKATGSITVQGMVGNACVAAGGDIRISLGMNAAPNGSLSAKGDIYCKFIENASVTAGGAEVCESIINSVIHMAARVRATEGRGAVIGGEIRALEAVEAIDIGNELGRMLKITLGPDNPLLDEIQALEEQQDAIAAEIAEKDKSIAYLEPLEEALSIRERAQLDKLREEVRFQEIELSRLHRRASALARKQQDYSQCHLRAKALHPPLHLIIGDVAAELRQSLQNVVVKRGNHEIVVEEESSPKEGAQSVNTPDESVPKGTAPSAGPAPRR